MINPKKLDNIDIVDLIFQRDESKYDEAIKLMKCRNRKGLVKLCNVTRES